MATTTFSTRAQHTGGLLDGLRDSAVAFIEGVNQGLDMAHSYNKLSRMSEDELRKRGLSRSDVNQVIALGRAPV
jgi:uncharacterized protein YjiS (DUF1127 family)